MFKKTKEPQLNIFSSPSCLFSGKSQKMYDDKTAWHNQFRRQVTSRIDESLFKPLYCSNNGTPNASIRVLISMMILKEAEGLSDQKLFENCRFNMLTRSAIGLVNADDPVPTDSTYYLFRKRIMDYANAGNENLLEVVFAQVTNKQCVDFEVSGKRIRMDSKLLGSNIAWLSRYELIHETFRLFYNEVKQSGKIDQTTTERLDGLLKLEGNKIVYTCSSDEVKTRLQQLGALIYTLLLLFSKLDTLHYQTLKRVFDEQFKVDENKMVVAREKEEITAQSVQSPYDTDCTYRNKDGNQVKGYSINITESCDDGEVLKLQKRNNVEATIFQLAYHYSNAKSRYRGLLKHQMWANIRCLWVNFVRIVNFTEKIGLKTSFFATHLFVSHSIVYFYVVQPFMMGIYPNRYSEFPKIQSSGG